MTAAWQPMQPGITVSNAAMPARTKASTDQWDAMPKAEQQAGGANIRNVWTIDEDEYQQFLQWKAARSLASRRTYGGWRTHAYKGVILPCVDARSIDG